MEELFIVLWKTIDITIGRDVFLEIVFPEFRLVVIDHIANHDASFAFDCVNLVLSEVLKLGEVDLGDSLLGGRRL